MSAAISIYEVGPRDGLQNLGKPIPLRKKVRLVKRLKKAGLKDIEVGSLVHPSVIPMRDSGKLFKKMGGDLLVLNRKGLDRAKGIGAESVNAVISTSDVFIQSNQNATYEDTQSFYEEMAKEIAINRLYISCCFSPDTTEADVLDCVSWGKDIARQIVLCDTDSRGTKDSVYSLCSKALDITPNIGVHLHVSSNITACMMSAYDAGIRMFDSSIGGLGGCISLTSAEGNIATEILVMWAIGNGIPIKQHIDFDEMMDVGKYAVSLESTNTERFGRWVSKKIGALL